MYNTILAFCLGMLGITGTILLVLMRGNALLALPRYSSVELSLASAQWTPETTYRHRVPVLPGNGSQLWRAG